MEISRLFLESLYEAEQAENIGLAVFSQGRPQVPFPEDYDRFLGSLLKALGKRGVRLQAAPAGEQTIEDPDPDGPSSRHPKPVPAFRLSQKTKEALQAPPNLHRPGEDHRLLLSVPRVPDYREDFYRYQMQQGSRRSPQGPESSAPGKPVLGEGLRDLPDRRRGGRSTEQPGRSPVQRNWESSESPEVGYPVGQDAGEDR